MTGKKKVGILATLALCVTVGGVYATWTYADTNTAIDSQHKHVAQDIAGATTTGAVGTLKVETAGLKFIIDQANDAHEAELVWGNTVTEIPVTFMSSTTASQEIKANGISVMYSFETSGTWDFDGAGGEAAKALYKVREGNFKVTMSKAMEDGEWVDLNNDGIKDFRGFIPASVFINAITLNDKLVLDTKSDYDTFKTALDNLKVGVTVAHDTTGTALEYVIPSEP